MSNIEDENESEGEVDSEGQGNQDSDLTKKIEELRKALMMEREKRRKIEKKWEQEKRDKETAELLAKRNREIYEELIMLGSCKKPKLKSCSVDGKKLRLLAGVVVNT
jgi:hypothetical protein